MWDVHQRPPVYIAYALYEAQWLLVGTDPFNVLISAASIWSHLVLVDKDGRGNSVVAFGEIRHHIIFPHQVVPGSLGCVKIQEACLSRALRLAVRPSYKLAIHMAVYFLPSFRGRPTSRCLFHLLQNTCHLMMRLTTHSTGPWQVTVCAVSIVAFISSIERLLMTCLYSCIFG